MFGRKSHGDVKKSAVKVLDAKKDTVTRLKHLKVVLENYETADAKSFFEQNYSHIYYVFYDVFIQVECDLKQRVTKAHKEELDTVLHVFEKILVLLPELIHKRWQYHSIGRLMKKMLHSGNTIKLRKEGMKLFLLWYKILMENATEECHQMFANLIPHLSAETGIDLDTFTVTSHPDGGKVMAVEISPMMVPQSIEKSSENVPKELLDTLLRLMVTEVNKVEWGHQEISFKFLFNKFKQCYLHNIFPEFKNDFNIYQPSLDLPDKRILDPNYSLIRYKNLAACQEVVIKWICRFTQVETIPLKANNSNQSGASNHSKENGTEIGSPGSSDGDKDETSSAEKSNTLTLGNVSERELSNNTSLSSEDHVRKYHNEYAVVRKILYSSRENINIIHEIFRQALLMPFNHSKPMKYVITIYRTWLEQDSRPVFMHEPDETTVNQSLHSEGGHSPLLNDTIDAPILSEFSPPVSSSPCVAKPRPTLQRQDSLSDSYVQGMSGGETNSSSGLFSESRDDESQVKVGLQKILQVFITNSSNVFLLEPAERDELLDEQIEMCKRVLNIYRYMVVNVYLDQRTWEQMLQVLLKVTAGCLNQASPKSKERNLGSQLAQPLIQTLIVTWIKANLNVFVSAELWDRFSQVLSSLTHWVELIKEWSKTMETLTRLLARHVYDLDLKDLPLDQLSEQKKKRRRAGVKAPASNSPARGRTFSRGWTKEEPVVNLRKAVMEGTQISIQENGASSETLTHTNGGSSSHPDLNTWTSQPSHIGLAGTGLESEPRTLIRSSSDTDLLEEKKSLEAGCEAASGAGDRSSLTEEVLGKEKHKSALSMFRSKSPAPHPASQVVKQRAPTLKEHPTKSKSTPETLKPPGPSRKLSYVIDDKLFLIEDDILPKIMQEHNYAEVLAKRRRFVKSNSAPEQLNPVERELPKLPGVKESEMENVAYSAAPCDSIKDSFDEVQDLFEDDKLSREIESQYSESPSFDTASDGQVSDQQEAEKASLSSMDMDRVSIRSYSSNRRRSSEFDKISLKSTGSDSRWLDRCAGTVADSEIVFNIEEDSGEDLTPTIQVGDKVVFSVPAPTVEGATNDPVKNPDAETTVKDVQITVHVTGPDDHDRRSTTASIASTVTDSTSMASVDSSQLHYPYQNLDHSGGSSHAMVHASDQTSLSNKSETEGLLYIAANASPGAEDSDLEDSQLDCSLAEGGEENLAVEGDPLDDVVDTGVARRPPRHKDSPTPDRESIHIDDMEPVIHHPSSTNTLTREDHTKEREMEESKGLMAGGHTIGWTPDAAVVLWRRMLGALGDINAITDPEIHAQVFEYFCDLTSTLFKMRDNMGVTKDNQSSPTPPELLPPVDFILPWLFEALKLPDEFKQGKLLAYRLLCMLAVRHHDIEIAMDKLTCFYCILHQGLVHGDQDAKNVLIKFCGPKFFSLTLPGSSMLILDFIHAACTIASTTDLKEAPRAEAISTLGALICYPNQFGETLMLQPEVPEMELKPCCEIKDQVINILLKSGKKEPAGLARCITISSLGIFLYEELSHRTLHPKLKDAVSVLLVVLRLQNKLVAQVASDMLLLLTDHVETLLDKMPDIPCRIIEVITNVISTLLPSTENSNSDDDKRLLVSAMFCLLEWCMRVPLSMLLDTSGGHKSLIYKVFRVLNMAVNGTRGTLTPRGSMAFDFMSPDDDLEGLKENRSVASTPRTPSMDAIADISSRLRRSPTKSTDPSSRDLLKLSARTVMSHLINHVGHFPMNEGAACLNALVKEYDDITSVALDELTPEIFAAPNVQFCVVNNSSLLSLVEIPAPNVPGGGVTAGLTTGKTVTRVIIRDAAGKFCWDSAILYGPPRCRAGSYPKAPQTVLEIVEDIDLIGCTSTLSVDCSLPGESFNIGGTSSPSLSRSHSPHLRKPFDLPTWDTGRDGHDNLDDLLAYIGHTSPECLLHPGEPLNIPVAGPAELVQPTECVTRDMVQQQEVEEFNHFQLHKSAASMLAQALDPMDDRDPSSPFQLCRLYLNQLGFFQWGKRPHVDLLKKSDKLLREIKHLDSQRWRDKHKIAVIYIGKGQEDKKSILNNKGGSKDYEDFVAGLGWEVDLETHQGFLGGLQTNKSTGTSTPYYATSTLEVIFHVSTRMPSNDDEDLHRKLRHLGNDEVQVIWSEHTRDYRRGIIPTEFGDVLLVIYPLHNHLFRIQINQKPEVPYFGPLYDGAIIDKTILPGLVRATAINAGKIMRSIKPFYQNFYEERAKNVESIIAQHKEETMFEDFAASIYAPVLPGVGDTAGSQPGSEVSSVQSAPYAFTTEDQTDLSKAEKFTQGNSKHPKDVMEPPPSSSNTFSRRLSFGKNKKSVTKTFQAAAAAAAGNSTVQGLDTPPDSPNFSKTKK